MTKKNLSDLLKEEAGTSDDAAQSKVSPATTNAKAETTPKTTRSNSRLTKADLEKRIVELEADLASTQGKEATLTKQIQGLKDDLAKQQDHIFELKDALENAQTTAKADAEQLQKVQTELAEAKQVILQMTEAAAQTPPPQPTQIRPSAKTVAKPIAKSTEKPSEKPTLSVKMRHGGDISRRYRLPPKKPIPDYAIEHGEQKNRMLSNDEIGWVD